MSTLSLGINNHLTCLGFALTSPRRNLKLAQLVKVYLNNDPTAYHLPVSAFDSSTGILAGRVENRRAESHGALIHLGLEGDYCALKILLFWLAKRDMPENFDGYGDKDQLCRLLTDCWLVGDKYTLSEFQDLIMLELLHSLQHHTACLTTIKHVLDHTEYGCPLRMLMVEELTLATEADGFNPDLSFFADISGAFAEFVHSNNERSTRYPDVVDRLGGELWKEYMLEDGPAKHWIWEV